MKEESKDKVIAKCKGKVRLEVVPFFILYSYEGLLVKWGQGRSGNEDDGILDGEGGEDEAEGQEVEHFHYSKRARISTLAGGPSVLPFYFSFTPKQSTFSNSLCHLTTFSLIFPSLHSVTSLQQYLHLFLRLKSIAKFISVLWWGSLLPLDSWHPSPQTQHQTIFHSLADNNCVSCNDIMNHSITGGVGWGLGPFRSFGYINLNFDVLSE